MLRPSVPGPFAATRMSPVDGRIATRALDGPTPESSRSAACCSRWSSVSRTGRPGRASSANSSRSPPSGSTAFTTTPGVPRSWSSYRACRPESPASSPIWYLSGLSSIISAVTSPTVPRIGAANSRVGASGRVSLTTMAPGMAERCSGSTSAGTSSRRNTIASTNASGPAASTCLAYGAAETPTSRASCRADSPARAAFTWVRSMPNRSTGRSLTSGCPPAPRIWPRSGSTEPASRTSPCFSDDSTTVGFHTACHSSSTSFRAAWER